MIYLSDNHISNVKEVLCVCSKFGLAFEEGLVVGRLLLEPVLEIFNLSATVEIDGCSLATLGVELEGGVALNVNSVNFVGGCVKIGNDESLNGSEILGELFPDGSDLLAVTAPWGVEFHEDVILTIEDNLLEVLTN